MYKKISQAKLMASPQVSELLDTSASKSVLLITKIDENAGYEELEPFFQEIEILRNNLNGAMREDLEEPVEES
jgi:hypothetical protein